MTDETSKELFWDRIFKPKRAKTPELPLTEERITKITQEAVTALENDRPLPVGLIGDSQKVNQVINSIEGVMREKGFDILEIEITQGMNGIGIVDAAAKALGLQRKEGPLSGTNPPEEIAELLKDSPKRTLVVFKNCQNFNRGGYITLARQVRWVYNSLASGEANPKNAQLKQLSFTMTGSVDPNNRNIWTKNDLATPDNVSKYYRL